MTMLYAETIRRGRSGSVVWDDDPTLAPVVVRRITEPQPRRLYDGRVLTETYIIDTRKHEHLYTTFSVSLIDFSAVGLKLLALQTFNTLRDAERYVTERSQP